MLLLFPQLECPCNVETEVDVAIEKIASCFGEIGSFRQTTCIRHDDLEHVTARFDLDTKAEGIEVRVLLWHVKTVILFGSKGNTPGYFKPPTETECNLIVLFY